METYREEMCKSLSEWFIVFYKENCQSSDENDENYLNDLSDGIAIAQALRKLAPDYFTGELGVGCYQYVDLVYTTGTKYQLTSLFNS